MSNAAIVFALSLLLAVALIALEIRRERLGAQLRPQARLVLSAWGGVNLLFVAYLCFNHVGFPLHLDLMEGTVLQHAERAARLSHVYPEPSPEYVPLAYNVLYYYLSAPFLALFGPSLLILRLVSIAGTVVIGWLMFHIVRRHTGSAWWGFMSAALFAAAYRAMDAYLDTAHSDSWLVASALIGSYLLDRNRSRSWNVLGVMALVASFWFKQHGALFVLGGLVFLTLREGFRAWLYWLVAALAGAALYLWGGIWLFGPKFHYFTWTVPSAWTAPRFLALSRYARFIAEHYAFLAASGLGLLVAGALRSPRTLSIWEVQFVFAVLSGLMGALDPGSSDNVFIPIGTWSILTGVMGLHALVARSGFALSYRVHLAALYASFGLLAYNPLEVIVSSRAQESYADLISVLRALPGTVYAPWQGQLPSGYQLYPAAHWVALDDMVRGRGRETRNQPIARSLLGPALAPKGPAYIVTNGPGLYPVMDFLMNDYVLETDFGDRFKALRVLPKRWDHGWPRYLYRYERRESPR